MKKNHTNLFKKEIADFLVKYEPFESSYLDKKAKFVSKYSPEIVDLYEKLRDFSKGGKRLRAFLVWIGYQIGGGKDIQKISPISLAFELAQDFVLMHDDIMDSSDLRRGRPTIHKIYERKFGRHYGESLAIILGDIACLEAFEIISKSKFSNENKVNCQRVFTEVLLETTYGQVLDIENEYNNFGFDKIMQFTYLKSAKYSVIGPILMGISVTKERRDLLKAVESYGAAVGLSYQLFDDILGIFGSEKIMGKSILSDMREGKNTLIVHKAKQLAGKKDLSIIKKIWGNRQSIYQDLQTVRQIVRKSGALAWCEEENLRLNKKAKDEVANLTADTKLRQILNQLADFVINRQK